MTSEIENSIPNRKKKGIKSIDVLQITDSEQANQKEGQLTNSCHHNPGKYMCLNINEQIHERDEEHDEDDDQTFIH